MAGRPDAGQTCTDYQYVVVMVVHINLDAYRNRQGNGLRS